VKEFVMILLSMNQPYIYIYIHITSAMFTGTKYLHISINKHDINMLNKSLDWI